MLSIAQILKSAQLILLNCPISAKEKTLQDFYYWLSLVLEKPQSYLYTHKDIYLNYQQYQKALWGLKKLAKDYPIEYLTAKAYFLDQEFIVSSKVLIPRIETALVIERAQEFLMNKKQPLKILDLGTGSGVIAICLAKFLLKENKKGQIIATDISKKALKIAKKNTDLHQVQIEFRKSDWLSAFKTEELNSFDLIISNPPYIAADEIRQNSTQFEPKQALISAKNGYQDSEIIIIQAKNFLKKNGALILEHGYRQQENLQQILTRENYHNIEGLKDEFNQKRALFSLFN